VYGVVAVFLLFIIGVGVNDIFLSEIAGKEKE
jgi:ABC-type Na+ efflux pump permease subunit